MCSGEEGTISNQFLLLLLSHHLPIGVAGLFVVKYRHFSKRVIATNSVMNTVLVGQALFLQLHSLSDRVYGTVCSTNITA